MPAQKHQKNHCPQCRDNPRPGQRTCHACHNAYNRAWRLLHPWSAMPLEQRRRANARSYAHVYLKRGKLTRQPCQVCGSPHSQMHHEDYSKPLVVTWLCLKHHLERHEK